MLYQPADESLHRADQNPVQHHRLVGGVVRTGILESESLGKIEIELHRRTLPLSTDRVDELEVELGTVKRSATFVDLVRLATALQHLGEQVLRLRPPRRISKRFVRACRELDGVWISEGLEHLVAEIEKPLDLRRDLLRRTEDVRIVLGEATHAHHSVQHSTPLVTVDRAEFAVADRQIAI